MTRILFAAAALILAPATAHAQDWVAVASTDDWAGAFFLDVETLKADGDIRTANVLAVLREDDGGRAAAVAPVSFECSGSRRRLGPGFDYSAEGKKLRATPPAPWRAVGPDTTYHLLLEAMCSDTPIKGEHFGAELPIARGRQLLEDGLAESEKAK